MEQLTEQELQRKIRLFLRERMARHAELRTFSDVRLPQNLSKVVVSRLRNISRKFHTSPSVNSQSAHL